MEEVWKLVVEDAGLRDVVFFILGGLALFISQQFLMTKKDRHDVSHKNTEIALAMVKENDRRKVEFQAALMTYIKQQKKGLESYENACAILEKGDSYFTIVKRMADAVLDGNVNKSARDNDFVPAIVEALEKSIPQYYTAMEKLSKKFDLPWGGKYQEVNYKGLVKVVKNYAPNTRLPN